MKATRFLALSAGVILATLTAASVSVAQSSENNKNIVKQMYEGFNTNDWDKLAAIITPDYIEHNPDAGQKPGFDGLKETFAMYRASFPDMKFTANHVLADGEWVCAHYTFTGTNTGAMMGSPATGKSVSVEGYDLVRVANGKMVEHYGVFDFAGMLMQLGKMPMPAPPDSSTQMKKD